MKKRLSLLVSLCAVLLLNSPLFANVKLPAIITDNMVLQQKTKAPLWGTADPGEKVSVKASWQWFATSTKAGDDGKWQVSIKTPKASGPHTITITADNTITLNNVMAGEVWLCSGQSNMQWTMTKVNDSENEIASASYPNIRLFHVQRKSSTKPLNDCVGTWTPCSPESVKNFSAVAYFFGRELYQELNIPIGLIHSSWGGTPAEAWTRKEILESQEDLHHILKRLGRLNNEYPSAKQKHDENLKQWKQAADQAKTENQKAPRKPAAPLAPDHFRHPSNLYNAMISPLLPYAIKGTIWYQGESNRNEPYTYRTLFPTMIKNWRQDFNNPSMPFYFVQIAPFNYREKDPVGAELREAQLMTLSLPHTGMAVTMDIGNAKNIHPKNKQDVGKRLALWALAKDYGQKKLAYSGPLYKSFTVEGNKIRISFDHAKRLTTKDGQLKGFTIAGTDRIFTDANATIHGETIVVSSDTITDPIAVRYAWQNAPDVNFFNDAGLPASSFRTDDFSSAVIPADKTDSQWWADRHKQKLAHAKQGNVDLLLVGDSITHGWEDGDVKPTWDKYYTHRKPFNIGYSGDRTENVLWRLNNGEIDDISPKVAVLMIGTNNTDGAHFPVAHSGKKVAQGITEICKTLREKLPDTKILILSIFPYGQQPNARRESNQEANRIAAKLHDGKNIFYLDLTDNFLNDDKTMEKEIMPDYLHPSPTGRIIWAEAMEPTLAELLDEKPISQ